MAQVWLARRADGAFKREVALKLPTLTHLRKELEQRFARERDILASLEHPHIARFYDAGIDPNGLPYVAMEYVQGQPLTSWCDAHRLGISARLELFVQVLGAVQYAHEKHVVHRDLKPSNILVTESGQVRLLDFGVARLLEAEEAVRPYPLHQRSATPSHLALGPITSRTGQSVPAGPGFGSSRTARPPSCGKTRRPTGSAHQPLRRTAAALRSLSSGTMRRSYTSLTATVAIRE